MAGTLDTPSETNAKSFLKEIDARTIGFPIIGLLIMYVVLVNIKYQNDTSKQECFTLKLIYVVLFFAVLAFLLIDYKVIPSDDISVQKILLYAALVFFFANIHRITETFDNVGCNYTFKIRSTMISVGTVFVIAYLLNDNSEYYNKVVMKDLQKI
uniref:Uncharacterized protein n=1 Tax=Megaviridae environmental sample TaxID=1737588 RepID=A0A5J6VJZ6_9VIRU|nr:MAG: hypothetical protein [Megaviridae environmental sample]